MSLPCSAGDIANHKVFINGEGPTLNNLVSSSHFSITENIKLKTDGNRQYREF